MNETMNSIDEKNKNKTVVRISRLFQKKPKKKPSLTSSISSISLSDPALSKQSSSTIASSQQGMDAPKRSSSLESRTILSNTSLCNNADAASNTLLLRTMSMSSHQSLNIQQLIAQQRHLLQELDSQKAMVTTDVLKLRDQLVKTQEKIQQRTQDMETLGNNYQLHLRSVRSSDDDAKSIAQKLFALRTVIHTLASELVPHAEPQITSKKLSTLWLNLATSIDQLGKPLPPERIQMLTEKFMMDVLVQNLNMNIFPGLACHFEFLELATWFDQHDSSGSSFSTRLRQELSMTIVQNKSIVGSEIEQTWKKCVDRNWHHLYRGLQKAYPTYLSSAAEEENGYGEKLRDLVQDTICLGSAIKGQEVSITAVDVREGIQQFDSNLMDDQDGQTSGTIAFCISPPFVVKIANRYEPLVKGRVLCFPTISSSIPKSSFT